MEGLALVFIVVIVLFVVWKLGMLDSIVEISNVATRESTAFNREHKVKVMNRYKDMNIDVDAVAKVNENIALVDSINFD